MKGYLLNDTRLAAVTLEEIASDGSDLSNPLTDHRTLFLGEDGLLHLRDSAGNITAVGVGGNSDLSIDAIWDAKGDLVGGTGSNTAARLAVGADNYVLTADSTQTTGFKWAAAPGASSGIQETLIDAKGDLVVGSAADTAARLGVGADGYVLTADSAEATGVKWAVLSPDTGHITISWDGGGYAIAANTYQDVIIPHDCTITSWTLLADQSGSAVVDIWKDTYANFPPAAGDSITASAKPTLYTANKATSSTLTGWTTTLTAGDVLRVNLDSVSTVTELTLVMAYTRTGAGAWGTTGSSPAANAAALITSYTLFR